MSQGETNLHTKFLAGSSQTALIALGSNIPFDSMQPSQILRNAIATMVNHSMNIAAVSRFYRTPCFPVGLGPDYVNAAVRIEITLPASELMGRLHAIENQFGRQRAERWGKRTLDVDLLAFGALVLPDVATYRDWQRLSPDDQRVLVPDTLVVPHPRLHERAFVLVPLDEVAPDWVHPVLGSSVRQMLAALPPTEREAVTLLEPGA